MPFKNTDDKLAYQRRYYQEWKKRPGNMKKIYASNKRGRRKIFEEISSYKVERGCSFCGEKHSACLEFHHTSDNKENSIARMVGNAHSIANIMKEIAKCVILCSNCHRKEHWRLRHKV